MAGNLAVATRSFGNKVSDDAYRKGFVGTVAGFETYKFDYANRIRAAGGSDPTIDTRAAAGNYLVPGPPLSRLLVSRATSTTASRRSRTAR